MSDLLTRSIGRFPCNDGEASCLLPRLLSVASIVPCFVAVVDAFPLMSMLIFLCGDDDDDDDDEGGGNVADIAARFYSGS